MTAPQPPGPAPVRGERSAPARRNTAEHRSAMLRRFGLLYWLSLLGPILGRLRIEPHSAEHIRAAAAKGPVVYALHTYSFVDWLALNRMLNRRKLPLAALTPGLRSTWLRPLGAALREAIGAVQARLGGRAPADPIEDGTLARAVAAGRTACVFLTHRRSLRETFAKDRPDPVSALLRAQAHTDQPVQVVPVVVIWRRAPEASRGEVTRFLLGNQDAPGPLGKLWAVLTRSGVGIVQAGAALDLAQLNARLDADAPEARRARTARILLRRYLYRESRVVHGPRIRPHRAMRRMVLRSPEIKRLVEAEAAATGQSPAALQRHVRKTLDGLAARMDAIWMQLAALTCRILFRRIYDGVDIGEADLERVRAAMRAGTPIVLPNHRSHLDYLLVSWVFYENDIAPPHIVAGDNLGFFPLGPVLRRGGAFFIRRSFKDDRIFPVVFERYLRQLIRDGFPIEFFIEGGRSRTGKMLPPRLGVLGMTLDAAASNRPGQEVSLLPVSIAYEQVAEERAYRRELTGTPKQREDLGQLLRASRVFGRRFGRVYLRVGEPILASEVLGERAEPWRSLDREQRKEVLQRTGERLVHRIAENTVVLPTSIVSMALLAQSRRGMRVGQLKARADRLLALLRRAGAQTAHSLQHTSWAVEEALERLERARLVKRLPDVEGDILQVAFEKRLTLEHYKNGVLHFVTPASLAAAAARALARSGSPLDAERIQQLFRLQVFLLRYEVTLDPEQTLDALEASAIAELLTYGALARGEDGALEVGKAGRLEELAELSRNLLESYLLVLLGCQALRSEDVSLRDLPTRLQEWGKVRLAIDELERHEALSLLNLKNAVRAFTEEGVVELRAGGGGLQFDEATVHEYVDTLRLLLLRREP